MSHFRWSLILGSAPMVVVVLLLLLNPATPKAAEPNSNGPVKGPVILKVGTVDGCAVYSVLECPYCSWEGQRMFVKCDGQAPVTLKGR